MINITAKARRTTASIRQIVFRRAPSRKKSLASNPSRSVARIVTGRSKNLVGRESVTGAMIAVVPRMRKTFAIFDPRTFPMANSVLPEIDEMSETMSSGILVPIATIVSPIIASDIPHFFASETAPSTRRFPPTVRSKSQISIAPSERRISISVSLRKTKQQVEKKSSSDIRDYREKIRKAILSV